MPIFHSQPRGKWLQINVRTVAGNRVPHLPAALYAWRDGITEPAPSGPRARTGPSAIGDGAGDCPRHRAAVAVARIFLRQRIAAAVGAPRRPGGIERARQKIWIVEIKSSIEDLRADQKWPDYRAHCDRLLFAFTQDLPCEIFPGETGLIVADAYGAHLYREAPEHRLPAPTRKLMTVRFAIAAAQRINRLIDPGRVTGNFSRRFGSRRPLSLKRFPARSNHCSPACGPMVRRRVKTRCSP